MAMKAELVLHNNDDLFVANVARVSFGKWHDTFTMKADVGPNEKSDEGLIQYLAKHKHISPFFHARFTFRLPEHTWLQYLSDAEPSDLMGFVWRRETRPDFSYVFVVRGSFYGWVNFLKKHPHAPQFSVWETLIKRMPVSSAAYGLTTGVPVTDRHCDYEHPMFVDASLRLTAPIPIARQMFTHRMFATNEISRRYVSSEPEFYTPQVWRAKPDGSIKQGSGDGVVDVLYNDAGESFTVAELYVGLNEIATAMYRELVRNKVAPEQARFALPQSMMTQVIFTGSLHDWAKVYHLRTSSHAQAEIRELTHLVDAQLTAQFGDLWTIAKEATQ